MSYSTSYQIIEQYSEFIKSESMLKELKEGNLYSFPFQYPGGHFIELFIKEVSHDSFYINDLGNIISELAASGIYVANRQIRKPILYSILKRYNLNIEGVVLSQISTRAFLPRAIHNFIEAIKDLSGLILTHEIKIPENLFIYQEIKHILDHKNIKYAEGNEAKIDGKLEKHHVDFLFQNGKPNIIVALSGANTKQLSELWGFRFIDIKELNPRVNAISIYDVENSTWSETSKRILSAKSDHFIPSDNIHSLTDLI